MSPNLFSEFLLHQRGFKLSSRLESERMNCQIAGAGSYLIDNKNFITILFEI